MLKIKYQYNRGKTCIKEGCDNKAKVKGMCNSCYQKFRKKD